MKKNYEPAETETIIFVETDIITLSNPTTPILPEPGTDIGESGN